MEKKMPNLSKKKLIECYRQMIRIRKAEEKLMEVFGNGEIPGFLHVCIGQEAAPVAVCSHLTDSDHMANTHRGHGHAIAKGIDLTSFMTELFGRSSGPCRGRSGSMHLADVTKGILGANGIVGGGIPIALGAAFTSKYLDEDNVTVCFFGEGATDEGTFHESMNIASVMNLPIVFICENNQWAEFTPQSVHMKITKVSERARSYGIPGVTIANDFLTIYETARKAVAKARKKGGPTLIEVQCDRWYGHYVGDAQKYRAPEDVEKARKKDCIASFEKKMQKQKKATTAELKKVRQQVQEEIDAAVEAARQSPMPEPEVLMDDLWA